MLKFKCQCEWVGSYEDFYQIYTLNYYDEMGGRYFVYVCHGCGNHIEEDDWERIEDSENS